ncbi:hypothetical protein BDW22DRAFT_1428572 [Trametopsis cervina]|nr:hypothetical protein BDW22DRAFT_1428572 [Trametopsis cervina]
MLAPPTISVPFDHVLRSDSPALSTPQEFSVPPRFPHTRAQLTAIARQYRPLDNYEDDNEGGSTGISSALVARVASLLDAEREEDLKNLLKDSFGPSIDEEELSQHVLDLMHRHRDDIDNVPFLFLTPTRRPISRPSSRASQHSTRLVPRPDTPTSAPSSPLAMVFRRPHTPLVSPLASGQQSSSYITARTESPGHSPIIPSAQFASSLPASPLSSPRILNAKAHEFKPIPRPLSSASSNPGSLASLRDQTPSPDLWSHNPQRPTSKLAIAAPLTLDSALLPRSGTPSSLRLSLRPDEDEDDEEDPFDPFGQKVLPRSFHPTDDGIPWSNSPLSNSSVSTSADDARYSFYGPHEEQYSQLFSSLSLHPDDMDPDTNALLTDGMTPLDVLSMVFGSTLAPSELEDALEANGYDFDRAMSWLVDRQVASLTSNSVSNAKLHPGNGRVSVIGRDGQAGYLRGGRGYVGPGFRGHRFSRPVPGGNRVCRYFLAGECLRADCRFSHDLERALCRFWLRGTCAKGENCEFLHHLPKDVDPSNLHGGISRMNLTGRDNHNQSPPPEDFPALNHTVNSTPKTRRGGHHSSHDLSSLDHGRGRFASVVKKAGSLPLGSTTSHQATTPSASKDPTTIATRKELMGTTAELNNNTAVVAPRPSSRLKLRPPTLLPKLSTGDTVNSLYAAYRNRAQQLGATRNESLNRAALAWKNGDGAAAKRFTREGHDLNAKMSAELVQAAGRLVRERAKLVEQTLKNSVWSDDSADRAFSAGKICAAGLGVCLGVTAHTVASQIAADGKKLSPEERTEVMIDLHGLQVAEATEVMEEFLLALERDHFIGLAYLIVDEDGQSAAQDTARAASRARLATGAREWLHLWGYPWSERDGVICVDPLTHA